jgi:hypothetical protein
MKRFLLVMALCALTAVSASAVDYEQTTKYPMDWIYAHVAEQARPHLYHQFIWVDGGSEGDVTHVAYMGILWVFGQNSVVLGYADEMVLAVEDKAGRDYPEQMLLDLSKQLGVEVLAGEYEPLIEVIITNPVGKEWPEESAKRGGTCHHPTTGLTAAELPRDWRDGRGRFLLRAGQQWTALYYYYLKVQTQE